MTIELRRLKASLQVSLGRSFDLPDVPKQLEREWNQLRTWLGGAGGGRPPRDRMRDATPANMRLGDARLVLRRRSKRFAEAQPCLIEDQGAFPRLLTEVDRLRRSARVSTVLSRSATSGTSSMTRTTVVAMAAGTGSSRDFLSGRIDSIGGGYSA